MEEKKGGKEKQEIRLKTSLNLKPAPTVSVITPYSVNANIILFTIPEEFISENIFKVLWRYLWSEEDRR